MLFLDLVLRSASNVPPRPPLLVSPSTTRRARTRSHQPRASSIRTFTEPPDAPLEYEPQPRFGKRPLVNRTHSSISIGEWKPLMGVPWNNEPKPVRPRSHRSREYNISTHLFATIGQPHDPGWYAYSHANSTNSFPVFPRPPPFTVPRLASRSSPSHGPSLLHTRSCTRPAAPRGNTQASNRHCLCRATCTSSPRRASTIRDTRARL